MPRKSLDLVEERVDLGPRMAAVLRPRSVDDLHDRALAAGREPAYWAELWPSGRTLAPLLGRQELDGVRTLELGCGLALPSLAAVVAGADVLATDIAPEALALARRNARRALGRRLATLRVDVTDPPAELLEAPPFDLVLSADALFRSDLSAGTGALLGRVLAPEGLALVAFPWSRQAEALLAALDRDAFEEPELEELDVPPPAAVRTVRLLRLRRRR